MVVVVPILFVAVPLALGAWLWWGMRDSNKSRTSYKSRKLSRSPQTFGKIPAETTHKDYTDPTPQQVVKRAQATTLVDRVERPPRDYSHALQAQRAAECQSATTFAAIDFETVPQPPAQRKPSPQPSAPVASARQFKPQDEATVCFVVGKAYRCRDRGYGETAHRIIRRQRGRVQMTCDVIQYCSDFRPWRTITIVDGVETLEKGKIRADDEYLGPQNSTQSYIDAARGET